MIRVTSLTVFRCCRRPRSIGRHLASSTTSSSSSTTTPEWRKQQLDRLTKKFEEPLKIENEEDLQPMWKEMESRVVNRRTLTLEQRGKSGRTNVRPTDEEAWLEAGLYHEQEKESEQDEKRNHEK